MNGPDDFDDEDDLPGGESTPQPEPEDDDPEAVEAPELAEDEAAPVAETGAREAPRQMGRAERAVLAAKAEAREAKEAAAALRREIEEDRRAREAERNRVNPAEEAARLAAMDPEERLRHEFRQENAKTQAAMRNMEMSFKEQADKATFAVTLAQNPSFKKYEAKVEAIYADHMAQAKRTGGPLPDRATILPWVIGQAVVNNSAKAVDKGRKAGAANIARQTTKPASPRGDVSTGRARGQSLAEKLADVTF